MSLGARRDAARPWGFGTALNCGGWRAADGQAIVAAHDSEGKATFAAADGARFQPNDTSTANRTRRSRRKASGEPSLSHD